MADFALIGCVTISDVTAGPLIQIKADSARLGHFRAAWPKSGIVEIAADGAKLKESGGQAGQRGPRNADPGRPEKPRETLERRMPPTGEIS
ncbi:MAG: hypothetical protein OXR84_13800 [Magnetovibrio sp.]|nr:hypothetical protein [Magnetovibrio sp.]